MTDRPTDAQFIKVAQHFHACCGNTLGVDDNAKVSRCGNGGAYVQAWIWINDEDAEHTP